MEGLGRHRPVPLGHKDVRGQPLFLQKTVGVQPAGARAEVIAPLKVRGLASPALSSDALSKRTHSSSPVVSRVEVTRHQMSRRKFRSIGTVWSTVQWRKVGDAANRQSLNCLNSLKSLALPRGLEPLFSP